MKRIWFIAVFFLFSSILSFGQQDVGGWWRYEIKTMVDLMNSVELHYGEGRSVSGGKEIEGSPYLNDEFTEGVVVTTSKIRYEGVPLRYNIYNDQIEIRSGDGQTVGLAVPEVVEKLEFGEYQLEYVPYMIARKVSRSFFVVEEEGYATLYSKPRIQFVEAKPAGAYQDPQPPRFVKRSDEYYIRLGREPAIPVFSKKDIETFFPDHKKEVESFIKKNNVRPNKPETLKELVQYYNSVIE
jgi:hypothetical protein